MAKKKKGKYDEVLDELPKTFGEEPARQVKINAIKEAIKQEAASLEQELTSTELTKRYGEVRAEEDRIAQEAAHVSLLRSSYEQLLAERFERDETSRVVLNNGAAVTTYYEPRAKVIDPAAFREWCIANGYADKLQLLWATTNSIVKERLLAGEDDPDGVVAQAVLKVRYNRPGEESSENQEAAPF